MKLISKILVAITALLSFTSCNAQIKNAKTETVKIYGNCNMCKKKIENAGNLKSIAKVTWDDKTQMATLIYDEKKTNQDEILKRVALVGYDSDKFLAPEKTYSKLDKCCQYDRPKKENRKADVSTTEMPKITMNKNQDTSQFKAVFDNYFDLKDALVKTDGNLASAKATALLSAINAIKMETLKTEEHNVWMKVLGNLTSSTETISKTQDIAKQRNSFDELSLTIYDLIKVSKQELPIYYQFCPMANDGKGANWLSKENTIKNPYYGSMMLNCGKVVETIK